eukprot:473098_1
MFSCVCATTRDEGDIDFDPLTTPREKKIKIALLGTSGSGKSTIITQLKQITESYEEPDAKQMTSYIQDSLITNMKKLCYRSKGLQDLNQNIRHLRDEILMLRESDTFNADIAYKIRELWHDEGIQSTLRHVRRCTSPRSCCTIDDNLDHFFNKIDVISGSDYKPDFEDYIRIQTRTIGRSFTRFVKLVPDYGECFFEMPDVGGVRSERKKWWSSNLLDDPNLTAIVYVVPLSDYNLTLYEDNKTNCLKESIHLFKDSLSKGKFFRDKPLFLLFNKYDIYVDKIKHIPITQCFDDFPEKMNPCDPDDVVRFIASKFLQIVQEYREEVTADRPLRIFRTTAIDSISVESVFDKIIPQIVKQNITNFCDMNANYEYCCATYNWPKQIELSLKRSVPSNAFNLNVLLSTFLQKDDNYKLFAAWMTRCFALESLLFCERISIFHEVVKHYQQNTANTQEKKHEEEQPYFIEGSRIKFQYKEEMYRKYHDAMRQVDPTICNGDSIDMYKNTLYELCREIFVEFVSVGSDNEVNISYEARANLILLFESDTIGNVDAFSTWDDFLYVFDESLVEILRLLRSMYRHRFKDYLEKNYL